MGNYFTKEKNILIEIRFTKNLWSRIGVINLKKELTLSGMLLDDNVYSQYYKLIYRDIRRYENIRSVPDIRNRLILIYGDEK